MEGAIDRWDEMIITSRHPRTTTCSTSCSSSFYTGGCWVAIVVACGICAAAAKERSENSKKNENEGRRLVGTTSAVGSDPQPRCGRRVVDRKVIPARAVAVPVGSMAAKRAERSARLRERLATSPGRRRTWSMASKAKMFVVVAVVHFIGLVHGDWAGRRRRRRRRGGGRG